ncbi:MAG TPA: AI-2E family transporter [Candidatus Sulfomarinibacteraceae bacterium]|nr:AI-2E family transporter [Candidatus Sulfomarinibacteraceae bacterium]
MAESQFPSIPPVDARRVSLATLTVAAVAGGFWLLLTFHNIFFLFFVAIVLSTAIKPAVDWMHRRGLPRPVGVIVVYLLVLVAVGLLALLVAPLLIEQTTRITSAIPQAYRSMRDQMMMLPNLLSMRLAMALPSELPGFGPPDTVGTEEEARVAVSQAIQGLGIIIRSVLFITVTLLLALYWTLEGPRIQRAALILLPMEKRERGREILLTIEDRLGRYIVGQGILVLTIAILSLIAYLLIGLPYALVLAVIAGIMELVPLIGPGLGAIPAAIIALSIDPTKAIWVVVATLVIQQLENNLLVPRIMNRAVGVNPLLTLLAFIALSSLFGITGALVAVPVAAVAQLLVDRFVLEPEALIEREPGGRDYLSVLRYEAQEYVRDVRRRAQNRAQSESEDEQALADSLEAIAAELDTILAQNGEPGGPG